MLYDIPFLRNVVLTDLISNLPVQGSLIGESLLLPNGSVPTRQVEWEVELGGRNIAPLVAYDAQSPLVKHPGIERKSAEAVDIRQKYAIREADLLFLRNPGERESRAGREIITRQLARMRSNIESRLEWMRWQAVLTGSIDFNEEVDGEQVHVQVTFGVPQTNFISLVGNAKWDDATNALASDQFKDAAKTVREANGRTVKLAIMNTNTHNLLDKQDKLRQEFRYVQGADDLVKRPHVTDVIHNIRIVEYDEGYKEDVNWNGTFNYFLPDNKVIFFVGARDGGELFGDMAFAPHMLADGSVVSGIGAENWTSPDPTREYIRVACVVMPRMFHPDWYRVVTVA